MSNCSCHLGSVCGPGCAVGRHHDGCTRGELCDHGEPVHGPCAEVIARFQAEARVKELQAELHEERACHDCDEYRALMRRKADEKLERVQTELSTLKNETHDKDLPARTRAAVAYVVERLEQALEGALGCTHDLMDLQAAQVNCRACHCRWFRINTGSLLARYDPKKPWVCTRCGLLAEKGYTSCPRCKAQGSMRGPL